ncbi:MAG TPA: hypothetical protein DEG92_02965, partial [Rikenellaceae bacterium]|nr:hypothetical protein [Rikenellaceae bacterium]
MKMKILIVNAHSYYNLGDAAILMTMIERLSMVFRDAEFTVISDTPVEDSKFYKNIKISGIKYPFERKNRLLSAFRKLIFYVRFWICVFLNKKIKHFNGQIVLQKDAVEAIKHIGSTDMVISCGGGYLNSFGKLFARLSLILCAIYYKKPTVMYSQSVSDLSGFLDKKLTVFTINLLDKFICREKLTYDYLTKLGVRRDKLKIRADSAL